MKHVVIIGGGISGLAAAYEICLAQNNGAPVRFTLLEASSRLGGTVETETIELPSGKFIIECGPDGWVSEKPWAAELANELGIGDDIVPSNDALRRTYLLRDGSLLPLPEGMRMMVPTSEAAIHENPLLSDAARQAYLAEPGRAEELRTLAANDSSDISVADFVRRHFGDEVTRTLARPLLAGIFGGDIERLSAAAVMPALIALEREHGSLILGLRAKGTSSGSSSIFTTLRPGLGSLIDALRAAIEPTLSQNSLRLREAALSIRRAAPHWVVTTSSEEITADALVLATPAHITRSLLVSVDSELAELHEIPSSSAVIVGLAFEEPLELPQGFGFLVEHPQARFDPSFLATTFLHQKYPHTAPPDSSLLRVFFGGPDFSDSDEADEAWSERALAQLRLLWPRLPSPSATLVHRWPHSLPQYEIGHRARIAAIFERGEHLPALTLLGNAYRGVGIPDLIRDSRAATRSLLTRIGCMSGVASA